MSFGKKKIKTKRKDDCLKRKNPNLFQYFFLRNLILDDSKTFKTLQTVEFKKNTAGQYSILKDKTVKKVKKLMLSQYKIQVKDILKYLLLYYKQKEMRKISKAMIQYFEDHNLTKNVISEVYKAFSQHHFNKYRHQFPRMRDHQIIHKILKQWKDKDPNMIKLLAIEYYSHQYEKMKDLGLQYDDIESQSSVDPVDKRLQMPAQTHDQRLKKEILNRIKSLQDDKEKFERFKAQGYSELRQQQKKWYLQYKRLNGLEQTSRQKYERLLKADDEQLDYRERLMIQQYDSEQIIGQPYNKKGFHGIAQQVMGSAKMIKELKDKYIEIRSSYLQYRPSQRENQGVKDQIEAQWNLITPLIIQLQRDPQFSMKIQNIDVQTLVPFKPNYIDGIKRIFMNKQVISSQCLICKQKGIDFFIQKTRIAGHIPAYHPQIYMLQKELKKFFKPQYVLRDKSDPSKSHFLFTYFDRHSAYKAVDQMKTSLGYQFGLFRRHLNEQKLVKGTINDFQCSCQLCILRFGDKKQQMQIEIQEQYVQSSDSSDPSLQQNIRDQIFIRKFIIDGVCYYRIERTNNGSKQVEFASLNITSQNFKPDTHDELRQKLVIKCDQQNILDMKKKYFKLCEVQTCLPLTDFRLSIHHGLISKLLGEIYTKRSCLVSSIFSPQTWQLNRRMYEDFQDNLIGEHQVFQVKDIMMMKDHQVAWEKFLKQREQMQGRIVQFHDKLFKMRQKIDSKEKKFD